MACSASNERIKWRKRRRYRARLRHMSASHVAVSYVHRRAEYMALPSVNIGLTSRGARMSLLLEAHLRGSLQKVADGLGEVLGQRRHAALGSVRRHHCPRRARKLE